MGASSEKCAGVEELRHRTLKELLTLARERFGSRAVAFKTRDELIAALSESAVTPQQDPVPAPTATVTPVTPAAPVREVITRDFFRRRS